MDMCCCCDLPNSHVAAYTGKSWVQPPVGPPFFISLYDLKNDFLSSVVIFSENITGGADELYLQGNDSCDAEVSSATPSTYMVGPMFLVSLHHILISVLLMRGYTETCYIKRVMLDKGDRKL